MTGSFDVYLEVGQKRTFAAALQWPGWCRSGRDPEDALEALAAYGSRYRAAVGQTAGGLKIAKSGPSFDVAERVKGNATTDFGAPGVVPKLDGVDLSADDARRLLSDRKSVV